MKKTLSVICIIFLIIMLILFWNLKQVQSKNRAIKKFNYEYEFYNREGICGVDITTVINKATDNNEKYEIAKDENGYYIQDDENSIDIEITLINNEKTYKMERIKEVGLESFVEFFGQVQFKCTKVEYHEKTGKISKMTFESLQK